MRSFVYTAAAVVFAATAMPALAQDAQSGRAPFTGLRVEGLAGWDRLQSSGHKDGVNYGVGAGYDFQAGGFLAGVEGEVADSSTKVCDGAATTADPRLCVRSGRDLYAGGRVGTVIGGSTLLYAKAGYTNARAKFTSDNGGSAGRVTLDRADLDGVRVGGGVEQALGPNAFLKAEYRYSNYEKGVERHQVVGGFGFRF